MEEFLICTPISFYIKTVAIHCKSETGLEDVVNMVPMFLQMHDAGLWVVAGGHIGTSLGNGCDGENPEAGFFLHAISAADE